MNNYKTLIENFPETREYFSVFIRKLAFKEIYVNEDICSNFKNLGQKAYVTFLNFILENLINKHAECCYTIDDIIEKMNYENFSAENLNKLSMLYCRQYDTYIHEFKKNPFRKDEIRAELNKVLQYLMMCAMSGDINSLFKIALYARNIKESPVVYFELLKFCAAHGHETAIQQIETYKSEYLNNAEYKDQLRQSKRVNEYQQKLYDESLEFFANVLERDEINQITKLFVNQTIDSVPLTQINDSIREYVSSITNKNENGFLIRNNILVSITDRGLSEYVLPPGLKGCREDLWERFDEMAFFDSLSAKLIVPEEYGTDEWYTLLEEYSLFDYIDLQKSDAFTTKDGMVYSNDGTILFKCLDKTLSTAELPAGLKIIKHEAFTDCESLTKVSLPQSILRIEYSAFSSCSSLEQINLPENLESIGDYAFRGCNFTRPPIFGINTKVSPTAFLHCNFSPDFSVAINDLLFVNGLCIKDEILYTLCNKSIKEIVIPSSVTQIDEIFFLSADGVLNKIIIENSELQISEDIFECSPKPEILHQ